LALLLVVVVVGYLILTFLYNINSKRRAIFIFSWLLPHRYSRK